MTQQSGGAPAAPMTGFQPNLPLLVTPYGKAAHRMVLKAHILQSCCGIFPVSGSAAATCAWGCLGHGSCSCVPNLKAEVFGCLTAKGGDELAVAGC